LDVKSPEDEGGGATIKVSARSNGSTLWRGEPQEGIDGRNHLWFRRRTDSSREQGLEGDHVVRAALRGGADATGKRQEGMGPERGTDRDEGKPLKGEAQGRSDALDASGGPVVYVAKGVTKPRT